MTSSGVIGNHEYANSDQRHGDPLLRISKDLVNLPDDLFLIIVSHLSPEDAIICRRVSRAWFAAFASEEVSRTLMKWHFPRSRDTRMAATRGRGADWAVVFAEVARRYHFLRAARPRLTEKIKVVNESKQPHLHRGIAPWNRVLRFNESQSTFQYRDPTWTFDAGLLVYPDAAGHYVAYDLDNRQRYAVPFDTTDKTVRRIRLACGVLVIEWCEREPYHQLNDNESVHRHFATAFDVERCSPPSRAASMPPPRSAMVRSIPDAADWTVTFRSEWKIHFLGLPLNRHDRFFSAHTGTHYVTYVWQPNRSPWGEEDPLELLLVWDISCPSPYRPSADPRGEGRAGRAPDLGPVVVQRLTWRELGHLGLRQRHTPSLRELRLDDRNVYVHEEEHRWLVGAHSSLAPPRHHLVRCTGFPMSGVGPRWFDECCADGDVHMSFCPRSGSAARSENGGDHDVNSADWSSPFPSSSPSPSAAAPPGYSSTWPGFAPCWRHEEFPYLTVSHVVDAAAGVRIVARQCFMVEALSVFLMPRISIREEAAAGAEETAEIRFGDEMWGELMGKGRICGDERFLVGEDMGGNVTIVWF